VEIKHVARLSRREQEKRMSLIAGNLLPTPVAAIIAVNASNFSDEQIVSTLAHLRRMPKRRMVVALIEHLDREMADRAARENAANMAHLADATHNVCAGCGHFAYLGDDITCRECKGYAKAVK